MSTHAMTIIVLAARQPKAGGRAFTFAQSGELPGFKVRDQWRFRRADIDAWIDKQVHPEPPDGARDE